MQSRAAGAQEAALDLLVAAALQPATRGAAAAEPGLGARLAAAAAALLRAAGSAAAAAALLGNLLMDPALRCRAPPVTARAHPVATNGLLDNHAHLAMLLIFAPLPTTHLPAPLSRRI